MFQEGRGKSICRQPKTEFTSSYPTVGEMPKDMLLAEGRWSQWGLQEKKGKLSNNYVGEFTWTLMT